MSDADRVALRIIEEGTFGVTPDGELLTKTTINADEEDDSYNDPTEDLTVFKAKQTILVSGFTTAANNGYKTVVSAVAKSGSASGVTYSADIGDQSFNDSGNGFVTDGFVAGNWINVTGFTDSDNNGMFRIVSVVAGKIVVSGGATELNDEVAGDAVTIDEAYKMVVEEALTNEVDGDSVSIKTAYEELRHTGESLKQETAIQESAEIRDDRQVADVKRASVQANGDINAELSYDAYNKLLAAGLESSGWSTEVENAETTYAAVASGNKITDSGNGLVSDGFLANQWVRVAGFTGATANNGIYKIVSVSAGEMVLAGGTLINDAEGASVTLTMGRQIVNGVAARSFSIEREYSDLSSEFALYDGMKVNQAVLNIAAEQIITAVFSLIGKTGDSATASTGTGTPKVAPTEDVMSAVDDVVAILENLSDTDASALTLTINNNLRIRSEVGEVGPAEIGAGKIAVSGTVQMFYESKTIMDKYLDQTETALAFVVQDDQGNAYVFDMPRVKYTSGQRVAGGQNSDIITDMAFSAYRDATEDVTIRICRFDA